MSKPEGSSDSGSAPPLGDRLLNGTLWMMGMRWTVRLLGIISIAVLARLLDQEDFGIVAMVATVIALPRAIIDMGVEQAIIREKTPGDDFYNTAWTMRFIQMLLIAAMVYVSAPWIAGFYQDERVEDAVRVLSIMIVIQGAENIWVVSFIKTFRFGQDFAYNAICKLLSVCITIALAVVLNSYWALIYGQIAAAALRVAMSFLVAPKVARPTLRLWRRIWSFSQWNLVRGLGGYVVQHGDRIILGRYLAADAVGVYTIGREIAEMPIAEISAPVNRALGPGFSALQTEPERLSRALAKSIGAVATLVLPMAIGLALTAEQLVPVGLGSGWDEAVPVLQLLAVAAVIAALRGVLGNTLVVIGHIRSSAIVMWLRAGLLVVLGVPGAILAGSVGMAGAFLLAEALSFLGTMCFYRWHLPQFTASGFLQSLTRPVLATALMIGAVEAVAYSGLPGPALLLLAKVAAGGLVYCAALYGLWRAAGRPDGAERIVLERLQRLQGAD